MDTRTQRYIAAAGVLVILCGTLGFVTWLFPERAANWVEALGRAYLLPKEDE